jgi:hypothetical protein
MGVPESNGRLCTKLSEMSIGDYIKCEYIAPTANVAGDFKNLGVNSVLTELATYPSGATSTTPNGYFYFIKADKGLLIADRIIQSNISAQSINAKGFLTGIKTDIGLIRSLNRAEFLKYISGSNLNANITKADVNVWHGKTGDASVTVNGHGVPITLYFEINQDRATATSTTSFFISGLTYDSTGHIRVAGGYSTYDAASIMLISQPFADISTSYKVRNDMSGAYDYAVKCFRPALEYIDNTKSINIWK